MVRWILVSISLVGLATTGVGLLWFLQGSDLVSIDPIACSANCEPMVGHQPEWQVAGAVAVLAGALATTLALRRLRR